jgi:hypothetical protein
MSEVVEIDLERVWPRRGTGYNAGSMLSPQFIGTSGHDAAYFTQHRDVAIQSTCGSFRNATLLDSDRPVGVLPDWVVAKLEIQTQTRQVGMSAESERHAVDRRKSVSQDDADFVVLRHAEALNNIRSVEPYRDKQYRWRLFCDVPSENRRLALGLKFVPRAQARTQRDEFWVETLIPQSAQRQVKE